MISTFIAGELISIGEQVIVNNVSQTEATVIGIKEDGDEVFLVLVLDNGVSEMNIPATHCKVKE